MNQNTVELYGMQQPERGEYRFDAQENIGNPIIRIICTATAKCHISPTFYL